jgi:hypothetical protein
MQRSSSTPDDQVAGLAERLELRRRGAVGQPLPLLCRERVLGRHPSRGEPFQYSR